MSQLKVALVLHGNSGRREDLAIIANQLSTSHDVVLNCDLPLHGRNRVFRPRLSIETSADYFADMLANYRESALTLVGFSDGANIVLRLLQRGLPHVERAVLISPNSRTSGIPWLWQFLFHASRFVLLLVAYVPALRRVWRRLGMMTNYHLDLTTVRAPRQTLLVYAEHDLILPSDQARIAGALQTQAQIIAGATHFSVLKSELFHQLLGGIHDNQHPENR